MGDVEELWSVCGGWKLWEFKKMDKMFNPFSPLGRSTYFGNLDPMFFPIFYPKFVLG